MQSKPLFNWCSSHSSPESFCPNSPGTKTLGMVMLFQWNAPWGLVNGGQALDHCSVEVWSPVLRVCAILSSLRLTCNQNLPCPHRTRLDATGEHIQIYFKLSMCTQDSLRGTVLWQRDGHVFMRRPMLYNTLMAAQVAVHVVVGYKHATFYAGTFQQSSNEKRNL